MPCITAAFRETEWRGNEEGVRLCASVPLMQCAPVRLLLDAQPTSTARPRTFFKTAK